MLCDVDRDDADPLPSLFLTSGVRRADQGAERLQGAAAGEGRGDLRAQSREEQHQGEEDAHL